MKHFLQFWSHEIFLSFFPSAAIHMSNRQSKRHQFSIMTRSRYIPYSFYKFLSLTIEQNEQKTWGLVWLVDTSKNILKLTIDE